MNSRKERVNTKSLIFGLVFLAMVATTVNSVFAFSIFGSEKAVEEKKKEYKHVPPKKLYDKVWKLLKNDFNDTSYNGQNWDIWRHRYDEHLQTEEDGYKAIQTMVTSLGDRYTRFLDREAFEEEEESIEAELTGVGIQIGLDKEGHVVIIAPIEGTPGAKAGLRPNDKIIEVDGSNTSGMSIEEAAKNIRGEVDTEVVLTIKRDRKKMKFPITRAIIPILAIPDGQAKVIFDDIGYIRLSTFISKDTIQEIITALDEQDEAAKGFIIDLRSNPGGLLNNAMSISDMFLEDGTIVSTVDRNDYVTSYRARGIIKSEKPMILLINGNSASASEIFSGAMRDNGRAELVGETTYGKGLVQAINKLGDGTGVNITISKYLTPNKTDINKKGIDPDHEVELDEVDYKESRGPWFYDPNVDFGVREPSDGQDKQLMKAVEVLKEKFEDTSPIPEEIVTKIKELDEKLEVARAESEAEKEKEEKKRS